MRADDRPEVALNADADGCPNCRKVAERVTRLEERLASVRQIGRLMVRFGDCRDPVEQIRLLDELELFLREHTDAF